MKYKSGKGFTLTELLVVVLVIAILVAVAVPIYRRTVERSNASDAIHVLDTVAAKQEVMWVDTGTYASNFATLGAPVKGLNTVGNATIGQFTYGLDNACATANKGDYTIYKNFVTQETGCTGGGCEVLKGLVATGTVGCTLTTTTPPSYSSTPALDICDIDPASCCPAGTNWNGTSCISCTSPKLWNNLSKSCQCSNTCAGGASPDPNTCACSCSGTCSGGKEMTAACQCECPAELPNWNGTNCVAECSSPRSRWTGTSCECPLSAPIYVSSTNSCISACTAPKEWNGSSCVCPDAYSSARINCIATGGSWNEASCGCVCASPRTQISGTSCVCPAPKTRFTGSSCECPSDRPVFHSGTGTCIGNCTSPTEWNFSTLQCECTAAALVKKSPCESSGGTWSGSTCTCSCASPRQLNQGTGECECRSPRSYWTGSTCDCPIITPNWNATNSTCNPPCNDPKTYWDGSTCICPSAKPKYVSSSDQCCLTSQGESCGGGVTNSLTGTMPCTDTTCVCPATSALKTGYCCSDTYPNFVNTTLGCCKTSTAGTACGSGATNSAATGKIDCNTGNCLNCSSTHPTLRNGYCCLGTCANGVFSGSGTTSCNCVCATGFKFNASTGDCDSCGPEVNFKWTDNQCSYTCNTGYCKDSGGTCVSIPTGQWRNASGVCQACTNKPAGNSAYTSNGGTANTCPWSCNTGNCYDGSTCKTIPTGQWRSGEACTNCTNKPTNNSSYSGAGTTSNNCPWTCASGTCYNTNDCVTIPTGQWKNDQTCSDCVKPSESMFTGPGTTNVNSCPWTCTSQYCWNGSSCTMATIFNFRDAAGSCVPCSGTNCWNGTACVASSTTLFRNTASGLCISCTTGNCWNATTNVCGATSNTQFRKSDGTCGICDPLTSCWSPSTESCISLSTTNFRDPSSGVCVACSGANCWNGGSCVGTTSTNFRNASGVCAACSGANCWNTTALSCDATSTTNFRNGGGTCVTCSGTNCWNSTGLSCDATSTTNFRNTSGVCVSCSGSNCWNTSSSACTATSTINFRNATGTCTACDNPNCWTTASSSCAAIAVGQWRDSGGTCSACTNKAASNSAYTGAGGTSNACAWQCNSGYCYNATDCVTNPVGQYRSGNNCTACTNGPANTYYTGAGTTSSNCTYSGNPGYCYNGTSYVSTPVGSYRSGENCTACTNKPANTTYTGNGGTTNSCAYSASAGYCYDGSSYIAVATGYYRNGENCTACTNKPANTTYTGNGGTTNSCAYSGNAGYCYNGSAYVTIPVGQYRNGENCTACTNAPSNNVSYTSSGGTTNSCAYSANAGYCYNGSAYVTIPVGQYRSGENCTACTNKPSNSSYTTGGGTTNSCGYSGTAGYCWNGSSYISTPTGQYRNGENCTACTNGPSNTTYTGNGGTTNSCAYSGNSGYCYNGSSYVAIPTGQYRSGEGCVACTNAPSNSTYTGNGGTSNNCPYSGNGGYCYNGTSYISIPTGQYRSGEACTACTNKPTNNSTYTGNGGTSNVCSWTCNSGTCYSGSDCVSVPTGQYRNTLNCTACTNGPANTYYTGNGGTSNSCAYSGNSGYCYNGTAYVTNPVGYYRSGENCTACTNKPANTTYTGAGTTSSNCAYSGNSGYCYNGSAYVAIPVGQYRSGENCTACTNKPSNTYYTGAGGTTSTCAYSGNSGYCYNGTSYVTIPVGQYRSGENCTACNNAPANTTYTGAGGTSSTCAYTGNNGYCFNSNTYVSIPTGYYRSGENCVSCTTKPANSSYTTAGGTTDSCSWGCNSGYYQSGSSCIAQNINCDTGNVKYQACMTNGTQSSTCIAGSPNYWNSWSSCSCNSGYCSDGSNCIGIAVGYYRNGESCTACTNKPSNTSYTGAGGTSNSCAYTGNSGYCYNGSSYVSIATGYYRSGETCTACSNKPSNTYYTGNGGTSNSCAYSGNSGYCYDGYSYVATATGYYRSGENCAACTNKPVNTTYTGNGGTSNSCPYSANSGYCYSGSSYIAIPTGQYRNGESCAACTNAPSNTSYTGNGGTSNSCAYTGNSGYCYNGSSYVSIPTGQYRSGENCTACTNAPSNTSYTSNGGTSNSCSYTGISGYCYNGSSYVSIPTGQYRSGENCTACTNKPANSTYTSAGGTSNSCGYTGNSGYCWNGSAYVTNPVGYYRSGEICTACTNAPANTYYTGAGTTSSNCSYTGNSGYCWNATAYVSIPVGQYRSGEWCASCTNAPSNTYYTSAGGTSNSCSYSGNSGYCWNGSSYVGIPTGQYRSGENCASCTNAPANTYYTGNGGTSNNCSYTGNSGYCWNGSSYVSTPTGYYRSGESCASCTNGPTNSYYSSNGGTSNSCSWACNNGYCWNGSSCTSTPAGYYRSGNNCASCTNAPSGAYYTSNGGTSNSCGWTCSGGTCYNGSVCTSIPTGQWRNGEWCNSCSNAPSNAYYTSSGGTSNSCGWTCNSGTCYNGSSCTSTPTGQYRSGEWCTSCTNAPSNAYYTGNGGTSNSCGWSCNSGTCYNGSYCTGIPTGQYRNGEWCTSCSNAPSNSSYTGNGGTSNSCGWTCNSGTCYNGSYCTSIPTGQYRSGEWCYSCSNAPSNAYYTSSGGTSNSCGWACNGGYCYNGSSCVGSYYGCSYSGQTNSDRSGCSNHGTRYQTCYSGSCPSLLYWGGWGSCSCDSGYTGSDCSSCASGYCNNGSGCVSSTSTCSSGQAYVDTTVCGASGYKTITCNTGTCPYSWSTSSCTCSPGYCLASPNTCINDNVYCSSGASDTTGSVCSGHGYATRYCVDYICPNNWGSYGACTCYTGYTGSDCSSCASGYCKDSSGNCVNTTANCSSGQTDYANCSEGTKMRTCNTSTCPYTWNAYGGCLCNGSSQPSTSTSCCGSGTKYRTVSCDTSTGFWLLSGWGSCSVGACTPGTSSCTSCGGTGQRCKTCSSSCVWGTYSACSYPPCPQVALQSIGLIPACPQV